MLLKLFQIKGISIKCSNNEKLKYSSQDSDISVITEKDCAKIIRCLDNEYQTNKLLKNRALFLLKIKDIRLRNISKVSTSNEWILSISKNSFRSFSALGTISNNQIVSLSPPPISIKNIASLKSKNKDIIVRYANTKLNKEISKIMEKQNNETKNTRRFEFSPVSRNNMLSPSFNSCTTPISKVKIGDSNLNIPVKIRYIRIGALQALTPTNLKIINKTFYQGSCNETPNSSNRLNSSKRQDISNENDMKSISSLRVKLSPSLRRDTKEKKIERARNYELFCRRTNKFYRQFNSNSKLDH